MRRTFLAGLSGRSVCLTRRNNLWLPAVRLSEGRGEPCGWVAASKKNTCSLGTRGQRLGAAGGHATAGREPAALPRATKGSPLSIPTRPQAWWLPMCCGATTRLRTGGCRGADGVAACVGAVERWPLASSASLCHPHCAPADHAGAPLPPCSPLQGPARLGGGGSGARHRGDRRAGAGRAQGGEEACFVQPCSLELVASGTH